MHVDWLHFDFDLHGYSVLILIFVESLVMLECVFVVGVEGGVEILKEAG